MTNRFRWSLYVVVALVTFVSGNASWRMLGSGDDALFVVGIAGLLTLAIFVPYFFKQISRIK